MLTVGAAYFSIGNHHPDEHFQILEFAHARLGLSNTDVLPWEFEQQARATVQPFMAMGAIKLMGLLGINNPFTIAFIIRLITGVCTWVITLLMLNFFIGKFKTKLGALFFLLSTLFLWFVPYLNVRFSSEILAGFSLLLAILLLLEHDESKHKKNAFLLAAGILLGFSFYFRFQIAAAIIGVFAWLIFYKKIGLSKLLILISGGLIAAFICTGIDWWFYEKLVFTPWNYFYFQLILGKAANFGVYPWWYYFELFFISVAPPISIFLFIFFITGAIKNKLSVLVWSIIPFVLLHMGIGHKEMRFMFPILPLFLTITALGFDDLVALGKIKNPVVIALKLTFAINILLLIYRTVAPAQEQISYYRFLTNISAEQKFLLISIDKDAYEYSGLPIEFYRSSNIESIQFSSYDEAEKYLANHKELPILIMHNEQRMNYEFANFNAKRIYSLLPEWLSSFNINDWQSRSNLKSIYRLERNN